MKVTEEDRSVAIYTNTVLRAEQIYNSTTIMKYDVAKLIGAEGRVYKTFLMDAFCNPNSNRRKKILLSTSSGDCGINCKSCTAVVHDGPPESLLSFVQKMGRAGRSSTEYKSPPLECTFIVSIDLYNTLFARNQEITDKVARQKDMGKLRTVMKLLLLPKQCVHQYLEIKFDHNENNDESDVQPSEPCRTKCWFCSPSYQPHPIRNASKDAVIKALRSIFCNRNRHPIILSSKLPKMILDHINKHEQKDSIWPDLSKVENSYAHMLVLALIAVDVLEPKLEKLKPQDEYKQVILIAAENAEGKQLWETDHPWETLYGE